MRGPALAGPFLFAVDRGLTPICADYTDSMRATTDFRGGRGWKDKGKSEFLGIEDALLQRAMGDKRGGWRSSSWLNRREVRGFGPHNLLIFLQGLGPTLLPNDNNVGEPWLYGRRMGCGLG